ncbi:hypothetical protein CBER1_04968 [Cercospora berteroae]|uniref:Uncharacterized protein n=1 Tax=Cercospora berteroae TaxID=357750 RepID=A0A2S6CJH3_9PEZI|nr:hypothetical protein CBER1_04968 [Cercospora berteroae]
MKASSKTHHGHVYTKEEAIEVRQYIQFKEDALRSGLSYQDRNRLEAQTLLSPKSVEDRQVERELKDTSSRPIEILQRCIKSGLASPHVLHMCFDAQFQDQQRYPRRKRSGIHQQQREDQLAHTALLYMLQDPGKWTSVLYKNTFFVDNLCYFAVLEGLQDIIMRFLRITPEPDNPYWRAKVVTAMILSEDAFDVHFCADDVIKLYFSLVDLREVEHSQYNAQTQQSGIEEAPPLVNFDFLHGAGVKLRNVLTRGIEPLGRYRTDPALYGKVLQHFAHVLPVENKHSQQEMDWIISELQLHHTAGYNEEPALGLLRKYAKLGQHAFLPEAWRHGPQLAQSIANLVKRTADVAEANSNMSAARWVFNTFEKGYFQAKPFPLERIQHTLNDLGSSLTHVQRRLCNALMCSNSDTRRLLSERVVKAPALQPATDPAAHANKFQNMLGTVTKDAKQPETQKRGFGL